MNADQRQASRAAIMAVMKAARITFEKLNESDKWCPRGEESTGADAMALFLERLEGQLGSL